MLFSAGARADKAAVAGLARARGAPQTVVDFYADWCGPCKMIAPYVAELEGQFSNAQFIKVNVDDLEEVAAQEGITAMPTFKFYKNGQVVHEFRGADKARLLKAVQEYI